MSDVPSPRHKTVRVRKLPASASLRRGPSVHTAPVQPGAPGLSRRDLEAGKMREIYLAAVAPGRTLTDEALSASRAHGEWFNPTPELEAIRKALPKAGVIETPDLVRLVEPLGVSEDRVQQVLVWALSQAKHSDDDGGVEIRPSNINYLIETHRPGKRDWVQIRERHENGEPFRTPGRRA
jgi:hypothetical protein